MQQIPLLKRIREFLGEESMIRSTYSDNANYRVTDAIGGGSAMAECSRTPPLRAPSEVFRPTSIWGMVRLASRSFGST